MKEKFYSKKVQDEKCYMQLDCRNDLSHQAKVRYMIINGFFQPGFLDAIHSRFTSEVDPC
jgi:hypothetical protein